VDFRYINPGTLQLLILLIIFVFYFVLKRFNNMTSLIDLLQQRRSIRKFETRPVEKEKINLILKAALMAPSSKRTTPWQFVVVDDKKKLRQMSESREMGSKFLENAPLAIVVLADEHKSNVWIEDASIAAILMQLEAEDLGLGSCWIQVRDRRKNESVWTEDYLRELLYIPEGLKIECIIALGYKDEQKKPFDESCLQWDKVHTNTFLNTTEV
jgi:nitroreductase